MLQPYMHAIVFLYVINNRHEVLVPIIFVKKNKGKRNSFITPFSIKQTIYFYRLTNTMIKYFFRKKKFYFNRNGRRQILLWLINPHYLRFWFYDWYNGTVARQPYE